MMASEIYNSRRYSVISYGNGCAYSVQRHYDGATLWFQDDDASEFHARVFEQDGRDFDDAIMDYDEVFDREVPCAIR